MGEVRASHEQPRKRRLRKCGASRLIVITSIYRETQTASCFTLSNGVYRDIYIYKLCRLKVTALVSDQIWSRQIFVL